jgi:The GLUG motif./S-layer homology domain.
MVENIIEVVKGQGFNQGINPLNRHCFATGNREEKEMKWKKRLSAVLICGLTLTSGLSASYGLTDAQTTGQGVSSGAVFTDIGGHWAENVIKEAAKLNIVGGYPDGTFRPDNLIKREEFFKLLTNIMTVLPDTTSTQILFTDVVADEWYVPTIKIAVASKITSGYGDGTFGIGMMISRQEAAKVAGSVISPDVSKKATGVDSVLDKNSIADWAYDYVDLMFKKAYMKGDTEGNFRPTMALTRAEAATILLNIKKNETIIAANADELSDSKCLAAHGGQEGAFTSGNGSQAEPYKIYTEAQLNHMRLHTTEGAFYILEKNIAITGDYTTTAPADIGDPDWREGNFEPIGSKQTPFQGNLDGNGFTISGLNIIGTEGHGDSKRATEYAGLFGYLAKGSGVADLTIDASNITGSRYVGGVAGYSEGSVKDCTLGKKGIINGSSDTGGLVGSSIAPLSSLRNLGKVTGSKINTGGIVGSISAPGTALRDCQNEGAVTGIERTGGIAGSFNSSLDSESVIKDCDNSGTVSGGNYQAGGIAGYAEAGYYKATIDSCTNTGEVTGEGTNGGIAGLLSNEKTLINQCKNDGSVEGGNAGGIVGNNQGVISNCYNSGSVNADIDGGGIAAYQSEGKGEITKCYNEGSVLASSYSGGITGENASEITYSYNSGKVRGQGNSGGISASNTGTVKYVYGAGVVTGDKNSGSLFGRNSGVLDTAFWLNSTNALGTGLKDSTANEKNVIKVTPEELSGQKKIKTFNGYEMLIDILNAKAENWKYLYEILIPAPGGKTVLSDGGSIVNPLEVPSTDDTGNTIEPSDLSSKYLYPVIAD